jgi:hypothetical protein
MLRFAAGAGSALLLMLGGFFVWQSVAQGDTSLTAPAFEAPEFAAQEDEGGGDSSGDTAARRPATPPSADARTKEQKRFDRADKDKNGAVALEEMFQPRRKAFAKLDTNGDGGLSFEEWAVRTSKRFGEADRDRNGALTREEFASTAPRRRAPARTKAGCSC